MKPALALAYVRIAAKVIFAHRLRSLLTVTSITIGAFSIVLMTSLADGGLLTIASDIEDLGGARMMLLVPEEPERMKDKRHLAPGYLDKGDQQALDHLPFIKERTWYAELGRKPITTDGGKSAMIDTLAADTGFLASFRMRIGKGRAFTEEENRTRRAVCVVGPGVAADLFDGDAVGKRLAVLGTRCLVVGQTAKLDRVGMNFGFDWDRFVVMPLDTLRDADRAASYGTLLLLKTEDVRRNDVVKRMVNAIMEARHNGVDDYEIWDFSGVMQQFEMIFTILKLIVALVASISLLVGGIGVMNMMFVSVSERTKEIGLRKALGASPGAIQVQFLFEAVFLSSVGGVLGTGFGVAAATAANAVLVKLQPAWVGSVSVPAAVVALLVSWIIGVGFGFVPARRAAALDAVEALRR